MMRWIVGLLAVALLSPLAAGAQEAIRAPIRGEQPQTVEDVYLPRVEDIAIDTWVDSLVVPWSLVFLPNGDALVAQRPGSIVRVPAGTSEPVSYFDLDVAHQVDAGLLGMALHPDFPASPYVYVMHTYEDGDALVNRVVRLRHQDETAAFDRVVFDGIPAARIHIGGRIAFGPDGMLYVGTGDLAEPPLSQDLNSLAGKILRLTPEGAVPVDNPVGGSPVYSYGHRVVQGLAWEPETGAMLNSEHGPSGFEQEGQVAHRDEINRVLPGRNYGWPEVVGAPHIEGFEDPILMWKNRSVPPGGMTFHRGDLFIATLGSQALLRIRFGSDYSVERIERWFAFLPNSGLYGRLRDVAVGPDGNLYVTTSNTDGRAELRPHDDKILRIRFVE